LDSLLLIAIYAVTVVPSVFLAKETKIRLQNMKSGLKSLKFLPLTVGGLALYVLFGAQYLASLPVLGWSWLGWNIALGPYADAGIMGILPFVPPLVYMLIHVNYFEELYFRKSKKLVVAWAFLHIAMGVAVHVALVLLPIGFLYQRIFLKSGVNYSYALHFATNLAIVAMSLASFFVST
jgi:hypothetical protein